MENTCLNIQSIPGKSVYRLRHCPKRDIHHVLHLCQIAPQFNAALSEADDRCDGKSKGHRLPYLSKRTLNFISLFLYGIGGLLRLLLYFLQLLVIGPCLGLYDHLEPFQCHSLHCSHLAPWPAVPGRPCYAGK